MTHAAKKLFAFLSSYGLSCVLFLLLLLLTYLGTLYQVENGLYSAQEKYFNSVFLMHKALGIVPVPLPGGVLLISILFVNLLCGGIVRASKGWAKLGIVTAHLGVCVLLAGSFVTFRYAETGHLTLFEGESSNQFVSYHEWEIAVSEAGATGDVTEYLIPGANFADLTAKDARVFQFADLPIELTLHDYAKNSLPQQGSPGADGVVDHFRLVSLPQEREDERNIAGTYVTIKDTTIDARQEGILWGQAGRPLIVAAADKQWSIELRKRRTQLPFALRLDKFTREMHPGTNTAKAYSSDVTRTDADVSIQSRISMNEPLRHMRYTLYQSSWGPTDAQPGDRLFSTLAVVRNPADQFPVVACVIVTLGMALHFARMLWRYLLSQNRRMRSATHSAASIVLIVALGSTLGATAQEPESETPGPLAWNKAAVKQLATLPVQHEGRVKPLDTVANVYLLKFNGSRSCKDLSGSRLSAVEWLAHVLLYPEIAEQYETFRVDNSEVVMAIGVPFEKRRDRYSYRDLLPGRERLLEYAREYGPKPSSERTTLQTQLVNLYDNMVEFESLTGFLDFTRRPFKVDHIAALEDLFPGQPEPPLSAILAKASDLFRLVSSWRMEGAHKEGGSDPNLEAATHLVHEIDDSAGSAIALSLIPAPNGPEPGLWLTPRDLTQWAFSGGTPPMPRQMEALVALEQVARARHDATAFSEALTSFHTLVTGMAEERGEYRAVPLEVAYHKAKFFYHALTLYVLSFVLVAFSWLRPKGRLLAKTSLTITFLPTLLLIAGITMRCFVRGRPPATTLYETILFATAVCVVVGLFIELFNRQRVALAVASFLGMLGLFIANKYEIREGVDTMPSMVAVLNTNFWLATHVTTVTIGYGAALLAAALGHVYVIGRALGLKRAEPDFYRGLARTVYGVVCFALLFCIVGTVLGGIWANESWGRFWGWDPKENGALMIVLWQLFILHARRGGYIRDLGVNLAAIFGGVVVAFAWFGVNLLSVGLHTYGFTTGVHRSLTVFYAIEGLIMLSGLIAWLRHRESAAD